MNSSLEIRVVDSQEANLAHVAEGFHPIIQQPGFAVNAYRAHYGFRAADPRFVVCSEPTEDATLAIAALAGLIPKGINARSGDVATLVRRMASNQEIDLLVEGDNGAIILAWMARQASNRPFFSSVGMWLSGVENWSSLLGGSLRGETSEEIARELAWYTAARAVAP